MQTLSMDRICVLDVACSTCPETREFLQHVRLATILHEDNRDQLAKMANGFRISFEEFSSYVWLQAYIVELTESFDDFPSPEVVAQQFGIDFTEFQDYIFSRARLLRDAVIDSWESEKALLEDLQEDAELQGD